MTLETATVSSAAIAAIGSVVLGFINKSKANQIHVLVNSNLSKVQVDLKMALDRVEKLESLLTRESKKTVENKSR